MPSEFVGVARADDGVHGWMLQSTAFHVGLNAFGANPPQRRAIRVDVRRIEEIDRPARHPRRAARSRSRAPCVRFASARRARARSSASTAADRTNASRSPEPLHASKKLSSGSAPIGHGTYARSKSPDASAPPSDFGKNSFAFVTDFSERSMPRACSSRSMNAAVRTPV